MYALPFLRTLRAGHPDAYIAWMVEERYRELLNGNPDLDEVIPVHLKHWRKHWNGKTLREISATRRLLKKRNFDWTFDLQGLIKTGILARLTGAPNRAVFHRNNCREKINTWFNNRQSEYVAPGGHVVDLYLSQLSVLGNGFQPKREFPLTFSTEAERKAETFMKENPDLTARPIAAVRITPIETVTAKIVQSCLLGGMSRMESSLTRNLVKDVLTGVLKEPPSGNA